MHCSRRNLPSMVCPCQFSRATAVFIGTTRPSILSEYDQAPVCEFPIFVDSVSPYLKSFKNRRGAVIWYALGYSLKVDHAHDPPEEGASFRFRGQRNLNDWQRNE